MFLPKSEYDKILSMFPKKYNKRVKIISEGLRRLGFKYIEVNLYDD